jgi:hypothetical protein
MASDGTDCANMRQQLLHGKVVLMFVYNLAIINLNRILKGRVEKFEQGGKTG